MCVLTLYLKVRLLRGFIASSYAFQLQIVGITRSTRRVHLSVQPYLSSVSTHFLLSTHLTCGHGYGCLLPSLEVSPVTGLLRDRYDKVFITQVLTLVSTEIITSGCNYSLMLPTWQATHGGYGWVKPSYPLNQLPLYLGLLSPSGTHMRGSSVFLTRVLPAYTIYMGQYTLTMPTQPGHFFHVIWWFSSYSFDYCTCFDFSVGPHCINGHNRVMHSY